MESMALGLPVISTYIAGIRELVRDGVDGWLVPAGDIDAACACLAASPETSVEMGRSALARVRERHNVDTEAARLKALFAAGLGSTS